MRSGEELAEALLTAAASGNEREIGLLLDAGADPSTTQDYDMRTALHLAGMYLPPITLTPCFTFLLKRRRPNIALPTEAEGHAESAALLRKHGASDAATDRWGMTPKESADALLQQNKKITSGSSTRASNEMTPLIVDEPENSELDEDTKRRDAISLQLLCNAAKVRFFVRVKYS